MFQFIQNTDRTVLGPSLDAEGIVENNKGKILVLVEFVFENVDSWDFVGREM